MGAFDTETTGLIENVTVKDEKLPEIIEFYGCIFNVDTGKVLEEIDELISLTIGKKIPDEIVQKINISDDMIKGKGNFAKHSKAIFALLEKPPVVAAHNAAFDKEMLDIEAARINKTINWPFVMCTVEQTMHLKGYRLSLSNLHELLFGEKFEGAHRAKVDVTAQVRCIVELIKREELMYHG